MAGLHTTESDDHADDHKLVKHVHGGAITTTASAAVFSWKLPFQIFTNLLLSLLLPLSFLLIARLSAARYLSTITATATAPAIDSFLLSYSCKAVVLYALVSLVTVAALVYGLTAAPLSLGPTPGRPTARLYFSWALLCAFQLCVGLGIEGTISAGVDGAAFANQSGNFPAVVIRALLFVGMHETMSFWSRTVVKPVVEDTVCASAAVNGGGRVLTVVERFGLAVSLGALWWWRLKEEVDALVVVPELMLAGGSGGGSDMVVGVAVLVGWWLYYLTVSIGTMRVLKGVIWVGYRVFLVGSATAVACRNHIGKGGEEKPDDFDISTLPLVEDMV